MSFKDLFQNVENILEKLSNKEYADHAKTLQKYGLTNRKHITGHNNNHCQRVNRRTNNQYRTIPYQIWAANNSNKNKSQSGNKIKTYYTTPNFYKTALRTIAMTNETDLDDPSKSFIIKEPTLTKTQGEAPTEFPEEITIWTDGSLIKEKLGSAAIFTKKINYRK